MVSLLDLKQAARVVKDEQGNPVVQVPLEVWEGVMGEEPEPEQPERSQADQIKALLKAWESEPDDKSDEWWDEFHQFLKENRFTIRERDLGLGDE